ncbi:hypothetical protein Tco_0688696, partial [Tanacetum coccineum]
MKDEEKRRSHIATSTLPLSKSDCRPAESSIVLPPGAGLCRP